MSPREAAELARFLRPAIADERVLAAVASIPRERFVPDSQHDRAYANVALPIGSGQTISQPLVVARMLEVLALGPTDRVLDVGTGSGYHAALLSLLADHVWTIERHAELAGQAEAAITGARNRQRHLPGRRRLGRLAGAGAVRCDQRGRGHRRYRAAGARGPARRRRPDGGAGRRPRAAPDADRARRRSRDPPAARGGAVRAPGPRLRGVRTPAAASSPVAGFPAWSQSRCYVTAAASSQRRSFLRKWLPLPGSTEPW